MLGEKAIGTPGDEAQLEVLVPNGNSIWVEGIIRFTHQLKFCTDSQLLKGFTALPVGEAGDVEVIGQGLPDDIGDGGIGAGLTADVVVLGYHGSFVLVLCGF